MSVSEHNNQIQYILTGSVEEKNFKFLVNRLRGLCDGGASATTHHDNLFDDHEAVYVIKSGNTNNVSLRVRRSLAHPNAPHQLRYLGNVEGLDKNRSATMRSCMEVETSDNISTFLEHMGFRFDYETVLKGYLFRKGLLRITVARLYKVMERGDLSNITPITNSYIVELTLNTLVQDDALCEQMKTFAEYLKPIVLLDKIEQKRQ